MKSAVRIALLALAAAALAFGVTHYCMRPAADADELAWLRSEFALDAAQVAAIEQLHDDYHPVCMRHCADITQARRALSTASEAAQPAARAELARLEAVCHDATLAHLRRVAAVMTPEQAERFLALVVPKVSNQSHDTPLGLK